jgi:hypothetical protein
MRRCGEPRRRHITDAKLVQLFLDYLPLPNTHRAVEPGVPPTDAPAIRRVNNIILSAIN